MSAEIVPIGRARNRVATCIRIVSGVRRGWAVLVAPPRPSHPPKHFKGRADAMAFALALQKAEGWALDASADDPFRDGYDPTPPRPAA